jgi:hypothetical protein
VDIVIMGSALVLCCVILWRGLVIGREGQEGVIYKKRGEEEFISKEREEGRGEVGVKEEEINLFQAEKNYYLVDGNDKVKILIHIL